MNVRAAAALLALSQCRALIYSKEGGVATSSITPRNLRGKGREERTYILLLFLGRFFCSVSSSFPLKPSTLTAGKGGDTGERHSFPLTFQLFFAFLSSVVFLPFCFRHFRELRGARKPLSLAERRGRKKTNENGFPPVVVFLQRSTIPSKQR